MYNTLDSFLNWSKSKYKLSIASSASRETLNKAIKSLGYKDIFSLTNNLQYDSYDKYFKTGLKSNWSFILKNANIVTAVSEFDKNIYETINTKSKIKLFSNTVDLKRYQKKYLSLQGFL